VKVRVAIKSKDPRIVPDMGVRVAFLERAAAASPAPASSVVVVPADAVRGDGGGSVVFVVGEGRVSRRSVSAGKTAGTEREILTGLTAGERVVVSPPPSLGDGDAVRVAQ